MDPKLCLNWTVSNDQTSYKTSNNTLYWQQTLNGKHLKYSDSFTLQEGEYFQDFGYVFELLDSYLLKKRVRLSTHVV